MDEGTISLRAAINGHLGGRVAFDVFPWSCRNSHDDRDEASRQLVDKLHGYSEQDSPDRLFLVAHSHGGHIALKALSAAPKLQHTVSGVVCISTPFVHVERRRELDTIVELRQAANAPWLLWLACLTLGFIPTLFGLNEVVRHGALVSAVTVTVWLILNGEPGQFIENYANRAKEQVSDFLIDAGRCPLLVLRVQGDEATVGRCVRSPFGRRWMACGDSFYAYLAGALLAALAATSGGPLFLAVVAFVFGSESIWRFLGWVYFSGGLFWIAAAVYVAVPLVGAISFLCDVVLVSLASALARSRSRGERTCLPLCGPA